jgi:hypothetical protein
MVFGQQEPLDPGAGPDDPQNRAGARQRLVQLGYLDLRHHEALEAAILDFQIYQGLEPTGVLDAATCEALDDYTPPTKE